MRNYVVLIFVLLSFSFGCKKQDPFIIEGKVTNPLFFGSKVYLVALDAPVTKRVDSVAIINGSFSFSIKPDSFDVRILRIPAKFPHVIEDLVVIPESGKVNVVLDSISHGGGTRLNNRLQLWKERKRYHDSIQVDLYIRAKSRNAGKLSDRVTAVSEKMHEVFMSDNICMINENLFNGIGLMIYKVYFDQLPSAEKNYVTSKTGKLYLEKDAQLRQRFY